MPGEDLLRFIAGPLQFPGWWLALGIFVLVAIIGWVAGVFVWTLPPASLRGIPVIRNVHGWITRRRFALVIRKITADHRDGRLTRAAASSGISRTLRSFLYVATGVRAQYMHVGEFSGGLLEAAGPLLHDLNQAQFNPEAQVDVVALGHSAEELVSSWT